MAPTEHIIFDCDGVLIDSEVLSMQVWIDLLAKHAIQIDANYFSQHFLGRSFEHVKSQVNHDFGFDITPALADEFAELLKLAFSQELQVTPFLMEVLPNIAVPYSLATSSSPERTRNALAITGLDAYFSADQIFTSSLVTRGKPAPDLFLHVAEVKNVAPEHCLVIEDSAPGLQAARAAKMQWRHYVGGSHLGPWGGEYTHTLKDWREFASDFPQLLNPTE